MNDAGRQHFKPSQQNQRQFHEAFRRKADETVTTAHGYDLKGYAAAQQEALFELLILAMYADGHLTTMEDEQLQKLLTAMGHAEESDLLGLTGFRPQTDHFAACGKPRLTGEPQFFPLAGGFVCFNCAARQMACCVAMSRGSLSFLQQAIRMAPALVTRLKATGQVRAEVEQAIEGYVTVVAGRRLPPADFLASVLSV